MLCHTKVIFLKKYINNKIKKIRLLGITKAKIQK